MPQLRLYLLFFNLLHFRLGLYHGYRVRKGGEKLYEDDCLTNKVLVISNVTAFEVDLCFRLVMSVYHHNATWEGLADEFNDIHCKGKFDFHKP